MFASAQFTGRETWFTEAQFTSEITSFTEAQFTSKGVDVFGRATGAEEALRGARFGVALASDSPES